MAGTSYRILEGFKEYENALRELPKATGKNVLRRIGNGALQPMADMAAAKAPYRSGKLAYSISVSEKRTKNIKTNKAQLIGGRWVSASSTGVSIAMGPGTGLGTIWYATFDEFGTVDTPAFAFMRGAWDAGANDALDYVKANLWQEIQKAAAKLAKKRAKLGAS